MIELIPVKDSDDRIIALMKKINMDNEIQKYVNDINYLNQNTYAIQLQNNYIGLIKLIKECDDCYSIEIGILYEFRNHHYGVEATNKMIDFIKKNYIYNKIIVRIDYSNICSIKNSLRCHFTKDFDEIEKCDKEGLDYDIYSIINPDYKQKQKVK